MFRHLLLHIMFPLLYSLFHLISIFYHTQLSPLPAPNMPTLAGLDLQWKDHNPSALHCMSTRLYVDRTIILPTAALASAPPPHKVR